MTFTSDQRQTLEMLRREYRIFFSKDTDRGNWPQTLKDVFETVQKLGKTEYDRYATDEDRMEPWKSDAKRQAKMLTEKAEQCVRRNEASWRFACEPLVFSRFSAVIAWYFHHFRLISMRPR